VTGGSGVMGGYIGRSLLRAGHIVASFSPSRPLVEGIEFIQGDVLNLSGLRSACRAHDAVMHLAVARFGKVPSEQLISVNVIGTVNVLEAAIREGVRKVIYASSNAVLGFTYQKHPLAPKYFPVDEDHPCEPQDAYGLSKLLSEITCKSYSDAFGIQTICLRINSNWCLDREGAEIAVRSGGMKGLTVEELWKTRYLRSIEAAELDGDWPIPGPPNPRKNLWCVTDARDGAEAFRLALENEKILNEVFLINGSDTCANVETPALIKRFYGDVHIRKPLNGFASLVSNQKATRILGYTPRYTWRESDFAEWVWSQ
ncbi:MAG: NAD(P)-dependent oxidoreductase, partial [Candidatus Acidiferrales bacterium]